MDRETDSLNAARGLAHALLAGVLFWAIVAACLILAGCGGSSGAPSSAAASAPPPSSTGSGSSTPPPPAEQCPDGTVGTPPDCTGSSPPPPLPTCPQGTTELYASICQCPAGDANGSTCVVPPPAPPPTCPAGTQGTYPACTPIVPPTVSLSADPASVTAGASSTLAWDSTGATGCYGAAGWPSSDELAPSGWLSTGPLTATVSYSLVCSGSTGTGTASVMVQVAAPAPPPPPNPPTCTPPDVLIGQTCEPPPSLSVSLSLAPTTVSDSRAGCPAPNGGPCVATLSVTAVSSLAGDAVLCSVNGSTTEALAPFAWSTSPYPASQDGPAVVTVACRDVYTATASAAVTLTVVPPGAPPADSFTGALDGNVETLAWTTYGTDGCYVSQADAYGNVVTLAQGGGTSGTASTGFLSPSREPFVFTLLCGGVPDATVPTITVSP